MTDRGSRRSRTLSDCQNVERGTKKLSSRSQSADYWAGERDQPSSLPTTGGHDGGGGTGGGAMQIDTPAGFRHVSGITNEMVSTIQAAERELFTDLSRAQAFEDTDATFAVFNRPNNGKLRISVAQEREILGGAYLLRTVEITKIPGRTLGFFIREGDGLDRRDGIHVSRLMLGGLVEESGLIQIGDEILYVNNVDVSRKTLDEVYMILQIPIRLLITLKSRQIGKGVFRSSWGSFTSDNISPGRFSPAALGLGSKQRSISVGTNSSLGSMSDRSPGSFTDGSQSGLAVQFEDKENSLRCKGSNQHRLLDLKGPRAAHYHDLDLHEESEQQVQSALEPDMAGSSTTSSSSNSSAIGGGRAPAPPLQVPVRDFKLRHLSASDAQHESETPKPETFHRAASFDPSTLPAEEDSDNMVFVDDEDYDDLREIPDTEVDSFTNVHGLRSSVPVYSSRKKQRPYSAFIETDHKGFSKEVDDIRKDAQMMDKKQSSGKLRRASSSDDVIAALTTTTKPRGNANRQHSSAGDSRTVRPRSAILEFLPNAMRRSGEGKARQRKPGQVEKTTKSSLMGKKADKNSAEATAEDGSRYVPKPSPDKKTRRISASKPLDIDATQFTKYKSDLGSRLRNRQMPLSGILTLHLYGSRKMAPSLSSRKENRDLYCVMEVDAVHKAQTATVSGKDEFCWDEKFEIDLERAHDLSLLIYSYTDWDTNRQKLCYKAVVRLTQLLMHSTRPKDEPFRLAVRLEPRGIMYAKFSFTERHVTLKRVPSLDRRGLFGVPLEVVVRRENTHTNIPIIVQKCIEEIELRGINMVGVYRVCGSAKRKKRLHDEFEASSSLVDLSRENYPDLNVITGVLKDYLRELPEPLFTTKMCQRFMDTFGNQSADPACDGEKLVQMIESLPPANRTTASYIMDHLKLIMVHSETNKMNAYNIAVCFGPVLMSAASSGSNAALSREAVSGKDADYEKHIDVLQTMLEVWPGKRADFDKIQQRIKEQQELLEEEERPEAEPDHDPFLDNDPLLDNQEEDSCYHSNDDLDETLRAKDGDEDGGKPCLQHQQHQEAQEQQQQPQPDGEDEWDSDNLQVSPC
ncbi:rho GTPase-activating protein 100F-like [Acanthaster planci]|uniref:Rho GTPase-activating protein 100F-like n=1 Tax=Acanthaster planci TaxID=133434 RepID=A0A8B7Z7T4_ACAPL|nr:rho GTPase-activating protein 100F-like [Acanthaster planci]